MSVRYTVLGFENEPSPITTRQVLQVKHLSTKQFKESPIDGNH